LIEMTSIGSYVNPYLNAAPSAPAAPSTPAAPANPAPVQEERSLGRTIAELPRKAIEGVAGGIGGVVGIAYHTLPGAVEGLAEGLAAEKGRGGSGWYTTVLLAETIGTGAAIGAFVGGPAGAAIGAGIGLVSGAIYRFLEGRADVPERFVQQVETKVDEAIADNTDGSKSKIVVQNMTEGIIVGTGVGIKEGWNIGYDAGKGTVAGVMDVTYGIAEGIWEAIRGKK
jgi:hypothetical protein